MGVYSFVCYETNGFDVDPIITQSSDDRHRDPWSVDHRREIHGSFEATHGYLLVFNCDFSIRVKRELKRVYRNGCRYNVRLNTEVGGS